MQAFLQRLGHWARVCYLIRVPLLTWIILFGFGIAANTIAATLLHNLFDQNGSTLAVCAVCFLGFLLSAIIIACINAVRYDGQERYNDPNFAFGLRRPWLLSAFGALPSFVFAGFVCQATTGVSAFWKTVALIVAFLLATFAGLFAKFVQLSVWECDSAVGPPPDVVLPLYSTWKNWPFYQRVEHMAPLKSLNSFSQPLLRFACNYLGPGYLYEGIEQPSRLHLRSTQAYLTGITIITYLLWLLFGWCKRQQLEFISPIGPVGILAKLPPLGWVLLLLMISCLALSGAAFFLDRFRIPLLWPITLLSLVTSQVSVSDHYFQITKSRLASQESRFQTAAQILQSRRACGRKRFVAIATAGGGIQAAAWTTKVLADLEKQVPQFRQSVLVISSVSGGSVGSMAYARTFDHRHPTRDYDMTKESARGALDAVAWGWFFPDVWRVLNPFRADTVIDRGWALEQSWKRSFQLQPDHRDVTIGDWAEEVAHGMPALIFNTSIVETGLPAVISNSRFLDPNNRAITDFYRLHDGFSPDPKHPLAANVIAPYSYDLSVATAARLSAAFPYVAPAARPNILSTDVGDYHFVDGGYSDNFGITSLFAWLENAEQACKDCEVLLLRVTHFPVTEKAKVPSRRSWLFQTYAPLLGLYDARSAGQLASDDNQVRLESFRTKRLFTAGIGYSTNNEQCGNPPLSWQLSKQQQDCVSRGDVDPAALDCIRQFVGGEPVPACESGLSTEIKNIVYERHKAARPMSTNLKPAREAYVARRGADS